MLIVSRPLLYFYARFHKALHQITSCVRLKHRDAGKRTNCVDVDEVVRKPHTVACTQSAVLLTFTTPWLRVSDLDWLIRYTCFWYPRFHFEITLPYCGGEDFVFTFTDLFLWCSMQNLRTAISTTKPKFISEKLCIEGKITYLCFWHLFLHSEVPFGVARITSR